MVTLASSLVIERPPDKILFSEAVGADTNVSLASGRVFSSTLLARFSLAKSVNVDTPRNKLNKVIDNHPSASLSKNVCRLVD